MALLVAEDLSFGHTKNEHQVRRVALKLRAGRTFGVLGGNECGKTTLARILLGELIPTEGTVEILGERVHTFPKRPAWLQWVRAGFCLFFALALLHAIVPFSSLYIQQLTASAWAPPLLLGIIEIAWQYRSNTGSSISADRSISKGRAPDALVKRGVAYISSEHDGGQHLDPNHSIEEAIGR